MSHALRSGRDPLARVDVRASSAAAVGLVLFLTAVLTALAMSTAPRPVALGLAAMLAAAAVWFVNPLLGLHFIVLFALIGDISTMPWYPYTKNLSAVGSALYINNMVAFSPLEFTLGVAFVAMLLRYLATGTWPFRAGRAIAPVAAFTAFVVFGLGRGLSSGGDFRVAIFEARAMLVLAPVYILVVSVCRRPRHYRGLLVTAMLGIELNAVISLVHLLRIPSADRPTPEGMIEHSAALRMNVLFLALIILVLFRGASPRARLALAAASVPVFWLYFLTQRRAAFIALGVAGVAVFAALRWRRPVTFRLVAPIVALLLIGYVAAFWNTTSGVGFPAQAVKSVISPNDVSARNESSDVYRQIETIDLNFTIKQGKLFGLGFGKPFYRPYPLADLSGFEFALYIPHNSILAIWIKLGFGGMVSLFCLLGTAIMNGARRLRMITDTTEMSVMLLGVTFVMMLATFAFVDIAWDASNMLMLALCTAICCDVPISGSLSRIGDDIVREHRVPAAARSQA